MLNACWYPSDTPCPSPRLDIIVWSMLACEISSTAGIDRPYQDPKCYFASQTDIATTKCQLHIVVLVLFSETGSNGLRHLFTFFRGGESMWVVFFRDSETWKFEVLEVVRPALHKKKPQGCQASQLETGKRQQIPFAKESHIYQATRWSVVLPGCLHVHL